MRLDFKDKALKTVIIYALFGGLWILFSDKALDTLVPSPDLITALQTVKGWLFIACTALLLYALIRRHLRALEIKEAQLTETSLYLDSVINSMPSVIIGVDAKLRVVKWNKKAELSTGLTQQQAIDTQLSACFPHPALQAEDVKAVVQSATPATHEKASRLSKGEFTYENVTIYPLHNTANDGAVIRIDDVTESVRMEETIIQAEKMMSVGGLAAGMAHEINNPLGGISQSAQNLERRLLSNIPANVTAADQLGLELDTLQKYMEQRRVPHLLEGIRESVRRAGRIVNDMLDFSRTNTKAKPHDLNVLLDDTIALAANDYNLGKNYDFQKIHINKDLAENLPKINCSASEIEQVILNLLLNAAQAMAGTPSKHDASISLRTYTEAGFVCIDLKDNGPGMDKATRKRAFEPFFTTKPPGEGTGLGLSVSYFIITRNHRGEMLVDSSQGNGCKFTIKLPITVD